jgi:hypothetical protein
MTRGEVRVDMVRGPADARAFIELPFRLYRGDPHWVPPLRRAELRRWSPTHNPALRNRQASRFLARRKGHVVGRIVASLDESFANRWAPGTGFFGFFECEDEESGLELFACAHSWLREHGATAVTGPVHLSTHDEVGLLVQGFQSPPTILSPYNPPWYERWVLQAGYRPARDYHAYLWTSAAQPGGGPAVQRLARAAARRAGTAARIRIRAVDPRRWNEEVRTLWSLYNSAFDGLWGFVTMTWQEFRARAAEFRAFYRPELVLIAEVDGLPAGFGLILPDVNAALQRVRGRLLPFGWLRLMRDVPRLRVGRFILAGVLPKYTGLGVAPLLAHVMDGAVRRLGMRSVELSLVQEGNVRMRHVIDAFGCQPCKTYRLYKRPL